VNDGPVTEIPCDEACEAFEMWSKHYDRALNVGSSEHRNDIGRMIFTWLKRHGAADALISTEALTLEICVNGTGPPDDQVDGALLDAPWELLAGPKGYFAADDRRLFVVTRRIGNVGVEPRPPVRGTLSLLFMSAAPWDVPGVQFEVQEARIRAAASAASIRFSVEEGGRLADFAGRIQNDGPFDVLHFSCHGTVTEGPRLTLEGDGGAGASVGPEMIAALFGDSARASVVFVDACYTDQAVEKIDCGRLAAFTHVMARAGVANTVGWRGSVSDRDANDFVAVFYGELAKGETVPRAAAMARTALFLRRSGGSDWHKARLYLGP
jgi:hypothetical protein